MKHVALGRVRNGFLHECAREANPPIVPERASPGHHRFEDLGDGIAKADGLEYVEGRIVNPLDIPVGPILSMKELSEEASLRETGTIVGIISDAGR